MNTENIAVTFCTAYSSTLIIDVLNIGRSSDVLGSANLGPLEFFNVTSANVVHFFPKFLHTIIQVYERTAASLVMIQFIFTIRLNMTRCCPLILHVFKALAISHRLTCTTVAL